MFKFASVGNTSYNTIVNFYESGNDYDHIFLNNGVQNESFSTSTASSRQIETDELPKTGKYEIRFKMPIDSRNASQGEFWLYGDQNSRRFDFKFQEDVNGQNHEYFRRSGETVSLSDPNIPYTQGEVVEVMFAFDFDNEKIWTGVNGSWFGDPENGTGEAFNDFGQTTNDPWRFIIYWYSDQVGDIMFIKYVSEYDSAALSDFEQLGTFDWEAAPSNFNSALESTEEYDDGKYTEKQSFTDFFSIIGRNFGEFQQGEEVPNPFWGNATLSSDSNGYLMKKGSIPQETKWRIRERNTMTIVKRGISNANGEWTITGLNPDFYYRIEIEDENGIYNSASLDWVKPEEPL